MDEFQENVDKLGILADELVALLPAEPATELEAKVAEMLARLIQHLEYMEDDGDEEDEVLEDEAAAEAEVVDVEAA
jgi:hypothetical protein